MEIDPQGGLWLYQDRADGDAFDYIKARRFSTGLDKRREWLYEITLGLATLHQRGVLHGDLKAKDGHAYLTDFGLSRLITETEGPIPYARTHRSLSGGGPNLCLGHLGSWLHLLHDPHRVDPFSFSRFH